MYAAIIESIDSSEIVAIHDDKEIVEEFIKQWDKDELKLIKIKKKKSREISNNYEYEEKYLVRLGYQYIPFEYYETAKELSNEAVSDLKYCRDVLFRLLEESHLTEKECKSVGKTIKILDDEIRTSEFDIMDAHMLELVRDLNETYKERIGND